MITHDYVMIASEIETLKLAIQAAHLDVEPITAGFKLTGRAPQFNHLRVLLQLMEHEMVHAQLARHMDGPMDVDPRTGKVTITFRRVIIQAPSLV